MDKKERKEIERQRRETALKNTFFKENMLMQWTF